MGTAQPYAGVPEEPESRRTPRRVRVRTFAKFGIPLLLLVGLTVGHSGWDSFRQSDAVYRQEIRGRLRMVAEVVADSVDPSSLDRLRSPTDLDRPEYRDLVRRMSRAAAATEIGWIGIFRESGGHLYLLADMAETGIDYPFFYATPGHWEALREGVPRDVRYTDEFGAYVGHVVPVRGPDGRPVAIVEASVQQDLLELFASQERARMLRSVALAAGIAMLLVLLLTILIVERPLRRLRHGVAMLSQGNFDHRLDIRGHDEFAQVADAFNGMAADLKKLYGGMEGLVQARTRNLETKNTELQEALQRLKGAQDLLLQREKMAAVGQLVSGVAHELNNPLAGIMGYAQICMDRTQDERQRGSLEKICTEAQRAGRIVRNLLTFSRKSAGEVTYVDVNEVIRRTLELRAYHLRTEGVQVDLQLHPDPLRTLADFHQLQQVFLNILNNATHAVRARKGQGVIELRSGIEASRIRVSIADNGPGIAEGSLGRIFDPFFTTKEVGEGTGLGLSICFGIVRQHHGSILARNRPEGGAEFVVDLPVILGERGEKVLASPPPASREETGLTRLGPAAGA